MDVLSVCPPIRIDLSFTVLRISMTLPRTTSPSCFTSALPESKTSQEGCARDALELGAIAYVDKPFDAAHLKRIVAMALQDRV